jgi:hypothetical protein
MKLRRDVHARYFISHHVILFVFVFAAGYWLAMAFVFCRLAFIGEGAVDGLLLLKGCG